MMVGLLQLTVIFLLSLGAPGFHVRPSYRKGQRHFLSSRVPNFNNNLDDENQILTPISPTNQIYESFDSLLKVDGLLLFAVPALLLASVFFIAPVSNAVTTVSSQGLFDPATFQPVCPLSDNFYQFLKSLAGAIIGADAADEYGPLIAGVLLRIRLEICVLESFLYEAVIPFIKQKGVSWILPLHETVETFLAGTIFAVASNFILLGGSKIISVLAVYSDVLTGMPSRFLGNGIQKFTGKEPTPFKLFGVALKFYGQVLGLVRQVLENTDTFIGRYLVLITASYITFKFVHFKFFNDIFP